MAEAIDHREVGRQLASMSGVELDSARLGRRPYALGKHGVWPCGRWRAATWPRRRKS